VIKAANKSVNEVMKDVCLLIALCGLARASLGAAAAEKTHRERGISFLSVRAGKASNSTQNGTYSVNPDKKTKQSSCLFWDRHVGLYCSKHWDAHKAKANAVDANTCMEQCLQTKGCQGVSVTNSKWGERAPWCHLCQAGETEEHSNMDTYWAECLTTAEQEDRNLANKLREIKSIEQTLCSAPGKVSSEEFAKIAGKAKLEEQYAQTHKGVIKEREEELRKLEQRKDEYKQQCEQLGMIDDRSKMEELRHKIACRSISNVDQQMENIEKKNIRELQMEEHALAMDVKSMDSQVKELSAKQHDKAAKLEKLQEESQKKEDAQFWKDWLAG